MLTETRNFGLRNLTDYFVGIGRFSRVSGFLPNLLKWSGGNVVSAAFLSNRRQ